MIQAVFFDIDGVLIDSFEANLKYFQDLMTKAGYRPPTREEYKHLFYRTMIDVIRTIVGDQPEEEIERVRQLGHDRTWYPLELLKVPEGTRESLEELAKTYQLGLVTSRLSTAIWSLPQLAVLKDLFPTVVTFDDVENHKPHPEPLLLAAQRADVLPEQAVYVGDAITDFQAAKAAGMKMIMYSNQEVEGADGYVSSFAELPPLVATF